MMPKYTVYRERGAEGQFVIIDAPKELKATGYIGALAILDTKNKIAYAVNASNMVRLMNGYANTITGVKVK